MSDSFYEVSADSCNALCLPTNTPVNRLIKKVSVVQFEVGGCQYSGHAADEIDWAGLDFKHANRSDFLNFCKAHCGVHRVGTLKCEHNNDYFLAGDVFLVPGSCTHDFVDLRCDPRTTAVAYRANM